MPPNPSLSPPSPNFILPPLFPSLSLHSVITTMSFFISYSFVLGLRPLQGAPAPAHGGAFRFHPPPLPYTFWFIASPSFPSASPALCPPLITIDMNGITDLLHCRKCIVADFHCRRCCNYIMSVCAAMICGILRAFSILDIVVHNMVRGFFAHFGNICGIISAFKMTAAFFEGVLLPIPNKNPFTKRFVSSL